jgi:hypothetical protein
MNSRATPLFQPVYRFQHRVHGLASSQKLEVFIMLTIVANTLAMLTQHVGMSATHTEHLVQANYVFVSIFAAEAVLKMLAYNPTHYFLEAWNVLDFLIVVASLIELARDHIPCVLPPQFLG